MSERATSVIENEEDEQLYFIWLKSWAGLAPEPQICTETFLPKAELILQKHKLQPPYDSFALESLMAYFPVGGGIDVDSIKSEFVKSVVTNFHEEIDKFVKDAEIKTCSHEELDRWAGLTEGFQ